MTRLGVALEKHRCRAPPLLSCLHSLLLRFCQNVSDRRHRREADSQDSLRQKLQPHVSVGSEVPENFNIIIFLFSVRYSWLKKQRPKLTSGFSPSWQVVFLSHLVDVNSNISHACLEHAGMCRHLYQTQPLQTSENIWIITCEITQIAPSVAEDFGAHNFCFPLLLNALLCLRTTWNETNTSGHETTIGTKSKFQVSISFL